MGRLEEDAGKAAQLLERMFRSSLDECLQQIVESYRDTTGEWPDYVYLHPEEFYEVNAAQLGLATILLDPAVEAGVCYVGKVGLWNQYELSR